MKIMMQLMMNVIMNIMVNIMIKVMLVTDPAKVLTMFFTFACIVIVSQ